MTKQVPVNRMVNSDLGAHVEGFESLPELASDPRSSWTHATDQGWRQLDPALWELTQATWVVLQTVSKVKQKRGLVDPAFRKQVERAWALRRPPDRS